MSIKFYRTKDPYGFLGNYYKSRTYIYDRWWNWNEAPYQSAKTFIQSEKNAIWTAVKANDSRLLGQTVTMRPDWDQVKYQIMKECCLAKFLQNSDLRRQLMETGNEELIEDTKTTNDMYWGCGTNGDGQNNLGKILMEIRIALQGE